MSVFRSATVASERAVPAVGWWVLLGALLTLHLIHPLGWMAALGLLAFIMLQRFRPFDFSSAYLMVVVGASVVNYARGALTFEMSVLTSGLFFMLFCYGLEYRGRALAITHARLTVPLCLFVGMTCLNFIRGAMVGNSLRYGGLELMAALGLGSALLIARREFDDRFMKIVLGVMWIMVIGHLLLGSYAYLVLKVRTGSIYFTPVPGVLFAFFLNFALRARTRRWSLLGLLSLSPMMVHQFLSFTRGYWLAAMAAALFSVLVYTGRGPGLRSRWGRAIAGLALTTVAGTLAAIVASAYLNLGNIAESAGSRFASSTGTQMSWETGSNVVRLVEAFHVIGDIAKKPLFGWGLGYYYVVQEPIGFRLVQKWYVHENYLLIGLKQGLVGIAVFCWMLWAAFRTGMAGHRHPEYLKESWCTGTAAATLWLILYCLVHFPLAEVNTVFTTALLWGGAMSITRTGRTVFRWKASPASPSGAVDRTAREVPGGVA